MVFMGKLKNLKQIFVNLFITIPISGLALLQWW